MVFDHGIKYSLLCHGAVKLKIPNSHMRMRFHFFQELSSIGRQFVLQCVSNSLVAVGSEALLPLIKSP